MKYVHHDTGAKTLRNTCITTPARKPYEIRALRHRCENPTKYVHYDTGAGFYEIRELQQQCQTL